MTNFTVRLLIESDWSMFSCALECSKQLPLWKYIVNLGGGGVILGHCIDTQKELQGRHKQRCLKIDTLLVDWCFSDGHFNASNANRRQCAGVIFATPGTTYLLYSLAVSPNVYAVFPPRLSIRVYLLSHNCQLTLIYMWQPWVKIKHYFACFDCVQSAVAQNFR